MPMPMAHRQWRAAAFEPHGSTAMLDGAMARGRLVSVCVWEIACVGCSDLPHSTPLPTQHPSLRYQDVGAKSAPVSIDPRWTSHDSGHGGEEMEPSEPVLEVNGLSAGANASAGVGVDIDAHPLTLENGLGALEMPTPSPRFEPVKTVRWRVVGRGS